jgi:hypothetical protein
LSFSIFFFISPSIGIASNSFNHLFWLIRGFLAHVSEGLSLLDTALILKEIAKVSGSVALIQDAQGELVAEPLRVYGGDKYTVEMLSKGELMGGVPSVNLREEAM